ncbi:sugar-binding transcriptional regulator [Orenia marismortui]|uniref:Central glycolytic genes regulator n=1 Tax=Orenia marismortui TaxID=46469 RepID=A0A4R8GIX8_9FIRM|nr:sugar-binding domain-containing protein [Orenia marismortui]TDX45285.1 central glycolytic genes regulator [Orenia marismortui]
MADYLKLQKKIAPKLVKVVERRYAILRLIHRSQPIGRRSLSQSLDLSERTIRKHLTFLSDHKFVAVTSSGAIITRSGERILRELDVYIKDLRGTNLLEERLKVFLGVEVKVVPTGLNQNFGKEELGRFAADLLKSLITYGDIIAVTGGTTLSNVAEMMTPVSGKFDITVVPARGGLGEGVEIQANTIAAKIASQFGGEYHLLHTPDNLKAETIYTLIKEPSIKKVLDLAKNADVLIHGIGTAEVMAKRRGMPAEKIEELKSKGAVGETFGYYFNQNGGIVYSTTSVGLKLSDLSKINKVIAVAGGQDKAKAILASVSKKYQDLLIIDERAAKGILELVDVEKNKD